MALTGTTNTAANTAIRYLTQNQAMAAARWPSFPAARGS